MPFRIGNLGGTTIDVDVTFLFLCAFFAFREVDQHSTDRAFLIVPVILVSLLIHELAHAGTIGILGFGPSRVLLAGMGGVTINERKARPWQELLISLAGPLASFAIVGVAFAVGRRDILFLKMLLQVNLVWGIFNILPVPPLDGGHAVRHFLGLFMRELPAFYAATWIGIVCGLAFALLAGWLSEIFIAVFMGYFVLLNFRQWRLVRAAQRQGPPSPPDPE
jgi:Zn-dependent protease